MKFYTLDLQSDPVELVKMVRIRAAQVFFMFLLYCIKLAPNYVLSGLGGLGGCYAHHTKRYNYNNVFNSYEPVISPRLNA